MCRALYSATGPLVSLWSHISLFESNANDESGNGATVVLMAVGNLRVVLLGELFTWTGQLAHAILLIPITVLLHQILVL